MRSMEFWKFSPGGNPTILVRTPEAVTGSGRVQLASALMHPLHLGAEQVGFLSLDGTMLRMDMMGGEFCANACRCAAMYAARNGLLVPEEDGALQGVISVSGSVEPIMVRVTGAPGAGILDAQATELDAAICLALPQETVHVKFPKPGICIVTLPGISHVLLDASVHAMPPDWKAAAAFWRLHFGLEQLEAAGVCWYETSPLGVLSLKPVVWVQATDSLCYESACGSGSLALALMLQSQQPRTDAFCVRQPSGADIAVSFVGNDSLPANAWIGGTVTLTGEGMAYC